MLTPIDDIVVSAGSAVQADKQIGAKGNSHAIIYTVPVGRVFTGWASNTNPAQSAGAWIVVGGVDVQHFGNFSTTTTTNMPPSSPVLTLLAGTSIKAWNTSSYYTYVFGVERDA